MSSSTHPYVVQNLYEFLLSNTKEDILKYNQTVNETSIVWKILILMGFITDMLQNILFCVQGELMLTYFYFWMNQSVETIFTSGHHFYKFYRPTN